MRKYRLKLQDGSAYRGTPKEIVTSMRDESWFDSGKPTLIYMFLVSGRHRKVTGKLLDCRSYKAFVLSLGKSVITEKFEEIE